MTALKSMLAHWKPLLPSALAVREEFLQRYPSFPTAVGSWATCTSCPPACPQTCRGGSAGCARRSSATGCSSSPAPLTCRSSGSGRSGCTGKCSNAPDSASAAFLPPIVRNLGVLLTSPAGLLGERAAGALGDLAGGVAPTFSTPCSRRSRSRSRTRKTRPRSCTRDDPSSCTDQPLAFLLQRSPKARGRGCARSPGLAVFGRSQDVRARLPPVPRRSSLRSDIGRCIVPRRSRREASGRPPFRPFRQAGKSIVASSRGRCYRSTPLNLRQALKALDRGPGDGGT
jgi:hypothetical protein